MKHYTIVYISSLGFYERFKTYADNKTEARKKCKENLGIYCRKIDEIYED